MENSASQGRGVNLSVINRAGCSQKHPAKRGKASNPRWDKRIRSVSCGRAEPLPFARVALNEIQDFTIRAPILNFI
jgi:hypothetical protein